MHGLPDKTFYGRRMPKEKFYSHLSLPGVVRRSFVDDVDCFVWRNKLSSATMNISEGTTVKEIAVFEVYLKSRDFDSRIFEVIDSNVSVYVVYVLRHGDSACLLVNYKESRVSGGSYKILRTFVSGWVEFDGIELRVEGLDLDSVYEGFVRQVAGGGLVDGGADIASDIEQVERRAKLERRISQLESKMRRESQFNKQIAISAEIKKLKNQL